MVINPKVEKNVPEEIIKSESEQAGYILLDWPALQETCLCKDGLVRRLLELYIQQYPTWIKDIRQAVADNDCQDVRQLCHTVRGATSSIHALACVEALEKLNKPARDGKTAELAIIMPQVILTLEQTGSLIRRIFQFQDSQTNLD